MTSTERARRWREQNRERHIESRRRYRESNRERSEKERLNVDIKSRCQRIGECLLWMGATSRGYGVIHSYGTTWKVHRIVYEQEIGSIPAGYELHHSCRNRSCCNVDHLEPMTLETHMLIDGRQKLTAEDVEIIRKRSSNGELQKHLADEFGVTQSQISRVVNGKNHAADTLCRRAMDLRVSIRTDEKEVNKMETHRESMEEVDAPDQRGFAESPEGTPAETPEPGEAPTQPEAEPEEAPAEDAPAEGELAEQGDDETGGEEAPAQ